MNTLGESGKIYGDCADVFKRVDREVRGDVAVEVDFQPEVVVDVAQDFVADTFAGA